MVLSLWLLYGWQPCTPTNQPSSLLILPLMLHKFLQAPLMVTLHILQLAMYLLLLLHCLLVYLDGLQLGKEVITSWKWHKTKENDV